MCHLFGAGVQDRGMCHLFGAGVQDREMCHLFGAGVQVGIPKTIDNDIGLIDRSFGFNTAVEEACRAPASPI